jgi:hypothetical protein
MTYAEIIDLAVLQACEAARWRFCVAPSVAYDAALAVGNLRLAQSEDRIESWAPVVKTRKVDPGVDIPC